MSEEDVSNLDRKFHISNSPLWRFFSSVRTAVALILLLVALSLAGTFINQVPSGIKESITNYAWWLENVASPQTGFLYPVINILGLFDVFHSPWFLGTGSLLIISIIICNLNRIKQTRANIAVSLIKKEEGFYKTKPGEMIQIREVPGPETGNRLIQAIKRRGYQPKTDYSGGKLHLAADKNRLTPLGTYLIHLSLILFIAGFLTGSYLGFRDSNFIVPEGATRDIGNNTNLALQLVSFNDEYWEDGVPKDYRSEVVVYESQSEVKRGTVRVNHPLSYKGVRIYQSFFGPAVLMEIKDSGGQVLYKGSIALSAVLENNSYQRPSGGLRLIQEGYTVYLVGRATNMNDDILGEGKIGLEVYKEQATQPAISIEVEQGVPYQGEGLEFTYLKDTKFSGFQISRDPGNNLIWSASGMLLAGLVLVFYFPRRRIWMRVEVSENQEGRIYIRTDSTSKPGDSAEMQQVIRAINDDLEKS